MNEMTHFLLRLIRIPIKLTKYLYYKKKLGQFSWQSSIHNPLRIDGGKNIEIGEGVIVKYKSWLAALPLTGEKEPRLILEDGCVIGHFNHIFATKRIVLHKNVLTADKVYISDNVHNYEDINIPILNQPIRQNGIVEIGEGSWLGENVCVIGASVGKHSIIGANSVVTNNIPDYSVAVGAPAKVIKQFDHKTNKWYRLKEYCYEISCQNGGG